MRKSIDSYVNDGFGWDFITDAERADKKSETHNHVVYHVFCFLEYFVFFQASKPDPRSDLACFSPTPKMNYPGAENYESCAHFKTYCHFCLKTLPSIHTSIPAEVNCGGIPHLCMATLQEIILKTIEWGFIFLSI